MTAQTFFTAWLDTVNEMKQQLVTDWRSAKLFTNHIKSSEDCVLKRIATRTDLLCYPHDYYSVDAVFYREEDLVPDRPEGSTWLRGLSVAFEHENNIRSGIYKEISHLLILDTDLRVLVTYPDNDIDGDEWKQAHDLIKGSRHQKHVSDRESFLIIIGWETEFEWQGYVYKEDGWKKVAQADM